MIVVYNGTKAKVEEQMRCFHDHLDAQCEDGLSTYAVCICGAVLRGMTEEEYEAAREEMRVNGKGTRI